ncbi:PREDICTED: uncharacterized protein LOC109590387, partial [Amphimedon queenslandica]|uniref:Death domain-containing protein n=1 Tax=Amphimedon queenslandica TaxID=400682 RepID=A0A1X7T131_AMPQE
MAESVLDPIFIGRTLNIRDLNEVIALLEKHHCSKASYHKLGLRLKLSHNTLEKVKKDHGEVDLCFTECLASWLRKADGVETPTIDTLIAALRGIGENAVADGINEERQIHNLARSEITSINQDDPTATSTLEINEDRSHEPVVLGVHDVHEMENRIHRPELHLIASSLQQKYYDLVVDVRQSLIHHNVDIKGIKLLIELYLKGETRNHPVLKKYLDPLRKIHDFDSLFHFLIDNHFIGYLNYNLLKRISKHISQDVRLMNQVDDYEKKYAELLNEIFCNDLVHLFNEWSHLSPNIPIGLPCISFRLGSPWFHSKFYTWFSTFGEFSWSYFAFLKQLRRNCIIITYAILPCVLDDVMRDLKDPVILKKLKDNDVTVFELPQEEEEDFEGKEEVIQTTLSEGHIPTTSTTTLTSEANTQQEVSLFKQRPEVASIRKEVKSSSLDRELMRSIESHSKLEEVIGLLEAGADPNVTKYSGGPSAVIIATEKNNIGIVEVLLEKGADPNVTEYSRGPTALIKAIKKNNTGMVEVLLKKGADPNVTEFFGGRFALIMAMEKNNVEIFKVLLENGADPNIGFDT